MSDFLDRIRARAELRRRGTYLGERVGKSLCFIQGDQDIANQAGAAFRSDLNNELQALVTNSQGNSAPGTTYRNQIWHDTTNNVIKRRNAANSAWIVIGTLDESFVLSRSSNTILGLSDIGKTLSCTSTFTQTFTAAATLGDGWWCAIRNNGSGVITLDPNASETVDGAATLELYPGEACICVCNGSAFTTTGLKGISKKVGSFTRDVSTASGTQAITGVGFKPKAIMVVSAISGGASRGSIGYADGSAAGCLYNAHNTSANQWGPATNMIFLDSGGGANYKGDISSFDADGFTINWTKTGSPVGTAVCYFLALR